MPSDSTNPSPIISTSHLCRCQCVSSVIHHLVLSSKRQANLESHEAMQARQRPASYPVQSTHSTPCITHSSTQVSNRRTNKSRKESVNFGSVHSFVSYDRAAELRPQSKKDPVIFVTPRFFRSCPRSWWYKL